MSDSEMEDYGFEYSDEDELAEDADLENDYYNSKGHLEQNQLDAALQGFQNILDSGDEHPSRDEWAFKALKQVAKIRARAVVDAVMSIPSDVGGGAGGGGDGGLEGGEAAATALSRASDALLSSYGQMLSLAQRGAVTMTAAEKKLGSLLDFLATTLGGGGGLGASPGACEAAKASEAADQDGGSRISHGERVLERVYVATLESLSASAAAAAAAPASASSKANERLSFRTRLRLASLWLDQRAHSKAARLLDELLEETTAAGQQQQGQQQQQQERSQSQPDLRAGSAASATPLGGASAVSGSGGDARAGTALLDVLALQIRLRTERGDAARSLRPLHRAASAAVASAIPHPRVLGAVRECGGLVAMACRNWEAAATDFFEAFRSYDEAGASAARGRCLRRCALATMLLRSGVDPFEAQEARPFRSDPAVRGTAELSRAFEQADALEFERVFAEAKRKAWERARSRRTAATKDEGGVGRGETDDDDVEDFEDDSLGGDRLFDAHLQDLRSLLRRAVVLRACAPYVRVRLSHLAAELGIRGGGGVGGGDGGDESRESAAALAEAEATVAALILDGELEGASIDQVAGTVELGTAWKRGAAGQGGKKASGGGAAGTTTAATSVASTTASSEAEMLPIEFRRAAAVRAWAARAREMHGLVVARMQAT